METFHRLWCTDHKELELALPLLHEFYEAATSRGRGPAHNTMIISSSEPPGKQFKWRSDKDDQFKDGKTENVLCFDQVALNYDHGRSIPEKERIPLKVWKSQKFIHACREQFEVLMEGGMEADAAAINAYHLEEMPEIVLKCDLPCGIFYTLTVNIMYGCTWLGDCGDDTDFEEIPCTFPRASDLLSWSNDDWYNIFYATVLDFPAELIRLVLSYISVPASSVVPHELSKLLPSVTCLVDGQDERFSEEVNQQFHAIYTTAYTTGGPLAPTCGEIVQRILDQKAKEEASASRKRRKLDS
jgi:hypothetical protein